MKIARGRGARASTRGITRMGTWADGGVATCISERARVELSASGLATSKASPSSPTPTASALEAQRPATLAGYPSAAAVAKPFGTGGSFAACTTAYVQAGSMLVESSVRHVGLSMAETALQPELSKHFFASVGSSVMISLHFTTIL